MQKINPMVKFLIALSKTQTILNGRFDRGLGGLGYSEFLILFHLNQVDKKTLRRVDLAEKIGLTASGVTRLLLPMEKVHLVKGGPKEKDSRVRSVLITKAGEQRLQDALERLDLLAEEILPSGEEQTIAKFTDVLLEIGGRALMV